MAGRYPGGDPGALRCHSSVPRGLEGCASILLIYTPAGSDPFPRAGGQDQPIAMWVGLG